jgi:hypothetical protein
MTETSIDTSLAEDLAARLKQAAEGFLADLGKEGRIVGRGDAGRLQYLRTQIEARRALPEAFSTAVETIADTCGYPAAVAERIATALHRRGLIATADEPVAEPPADPEPEHAPIEDGEPTLLVNGAIVLPRLRSRTLPAGLTATRPIAVTRIGAPGQARPAVALPPDVDDFEEKAADRHAAAVKVAADLQTTHGHRLEVTQIKPDTGRVVVVIRAAATEDWDYWLRVIGTPGGVGQRRTGDVLMGSGHVDTVPVHLTAHGMPALLQAAYDAATEPFHLWGRVYDLARGLVDAAGQTWLYLGRRQEGGMPLVVLRGGDQTQYPLGSVVVHCGPLRAGEPTTVAAPQAGGEGSDGRA